MMNHNPEQYEHLFLIDRLMMFTFMEIPSAPSRMNFVDGEVHEKNNEVKMKPDMKYSLVLLRNHENS
jgi:hypothetical protein